MSICGEGIDKFLDKIIMGDCLEVLPTLPESCVDMVFIDPPYFLQLPQRRLIRWTVRTTVEGVNEKWDKFASFEEYDLFLRRSLEAIKRVAKPKVL